MNTLEDLPNEILVKDILPTLPLGYMLNLCQANKKFSLLCQDDIIWRYRLINEFGDLNKPINFSWKEYYYSLVELNILSLSIHDLVEDWILKLEFKYPRGKHGIYYSEKYLYPIFSKYMEGYLLKYPQNIDLVNKVLVRLLRYSIGIYLDMKNNRYRQYDIYMLDDEFDRVLGILNNKINMLEEKNL